MQFCNFLLLSVHIYLHEVIGFYYSTLNYNGVMVIHSLISILVYTHLGWVQDGEEPCKYCGIAVNCQNPKHPGQPQQGKKDKNGLQCSSVNRWRVNNFHANLHNFHDNFSGCIIFMVFVGRPLAWLCSLYHKFCWNKENFVSQKFGTIRHYSTIYLRCVIFLVFMVLWAVIP